jgi:hypothetical protein
MSSEQNQFTPGFLLMVVVLFCFLVVGLFPAIILIYPFSDGLQHAIVTARDSWLAWIWSGAVWFAVYTAWKSKGG